MLGVEEAKITKAGFPSRPKRGFGEIAGLEAGGGGKEQPGAVQAVPLPGARPSPFRTPDRPSIGPG